jgi:4-amino-4-deoxy-L-arabinose transferase-like glycosyltransferase
MESGDRQTELPRAELPHALIPCLLLATGLLLYLPWLGSYGPLDPTDSFFIESGREAFATNQYLLPLQNYKPWLDKPILYFWSVAGTYQLLGVNPFAGRLVSALSAVYIGLSTYFFAWPYIGRREAAIGAAIFMTLPLTCAIGHLSLTDMPLTALMSTALFAIFHFEKSGKLSACLIAYVALALAFLCKGPIAVIIAAAIYGLYLFLTNKLSDIPSRIMKARPLLGLAIMFAINLPWYTMATIGTNGLFLKDFFITQNFGRMVGAVNH